MPRINANRPQQRAPRLISTTPSAGRAIDPLSGVADGLERLAQVGLNKAREDRARADQIAAARAESAFQLEMGQALDRASQAYDGSAPGFAEAQEEVFDLAMGAALEQAPEQIRPQLEARFERLRARHLLAAGEVEANAAGRYAYQGFLEHVDQTANAVTGEPGYFPDALESIETAAAALPAALQGRARAEAVGQVSRSYAETRLTGDARGFLAELESGALDAIFPAEVRRSYTSQAQAEIERQARAAQIARNQAAAAEARVLDRLLDDAQDAAEQGFTPDISFSALAARAEALGGEEGADLQRRAIEAGEISAMTEALRVQPVAALEQSIAQERASLSAGASGFEARRVAAAERTLSAMRGALREDPVAYGRRAGVGDLPPLDLSSIDAFGNSLAQRAPRAQALADHYGVERKIFTRAERTALSEAIARGDFDPLTAAQIVVDSLGRDAPAALAEIAPDEPGLAQVGGLMSAGADAAARDLAAGYGLRGQDGFSSRLPSSFEREGAAADVLGDLAARLPQTALEITDAAEAIYEARALRQGMVQTSEGAWPRGGKDLFERALHEAAGAVYVAGERYGGFVDHRGGSLIAPNWIHEDRFDDAVRAIAGGDLGPRALMVDGRGQPVSMAALERARLRSIGDQRYLVEIGRDGGSLLDDRGAPFVLDMSVYRRDLARAYPDWVR
jgi:hypothetical protein